MSKLTLEERLAAAELTVAKIKGEIAQRDRLANLTFGTHIVFEYGRGDTRREISGTVGGVRADGKVAVFSTDLDPFVILPSAILTVTNNCPEGPEVTQPEALTTEEQFDEAAPVASENPLDMD